MSAKSRQSVRSLNSAQSKVDYYLRAESRLSTIPKPDQEEGENKGQYAWRLIRQCVRHAINLMKKADKKDVIVQHGMEHMRKLNHGQKVLHMVYNNNTKEYVSLDGYTIRVFKTDGRRHDIFTPEEPFSQLLYSSQNNLYIGWTPHEKNMKLMTPDFEITSSSNAIGPVLAAVYNENIGEVVTVGAGFLTSWVFRYGGRHILPRKTCQEGINPDHQFTHLVLEETASRSQKAFAACGASVTVVNLCDGVLLSCKKELHSRDITAILFFNPLKYLVTGAKDGTIKVWDENWHLQLVFVGHDGQINDLSVYPFGPNIMSASADNTLRVWSLETCDEVACVDSEDPVEAVGTCVSQENFFSFSGNHGDLWRVKNIHTLHTRVGYRVTNIKSTDHPEYPTRSLLLCSDASIRIMSPTTGDVLTTLLMPRRRKLIDAAYAIADDELYAVFSNGDIIVADTSTNPCQIKYEWKCQDFSMACNYLLVYEYVISAELSEDSWTGMKRAIATKGIAADPGSAQRKEKNANRTLLLGGRKDGHICVFNRQTGAVEFEIEAHGTKGVLSMMANSKADQLISAGLDNIIKVWRLFPYAQESLAPLMSFYCAHTPIYMTVLRDKLAVAFQEHATATYSVVMYNLKGKNRHDHAPEEDHMDSINGLSSCQKMRLTASCSSDGTIRIWNEINSLTRLIKLNAVPHSVSFCSEKGDLLVGIADHVHKIDYKSYMPKDYRFKMVSMRFLAMKEEKALPYDDNLINQMSRDDVKRLKAARSSFKFTHFVDVLTKDENTEVMREKKAREKAFAILEDRENELMKIKDGELHASKKPKSTAVTKREAFNKYLSFFYNRPEIKLPEDDAYPEDTVKDALKGAPPTPEPEKYHEDKEPTGFFPPLSNAESKPGSRPIRADGFVPNSVLVRLLWPQDALAEKQKTQEAEQGWKPPPLTKEQLAQIASTKKRKLTKLAGRAKTLSFMKRGDTQASEPDRILVMDYDDHDEQQKAESVNEEEEEEPAIPAALLAKVQNIMDQEATPEPTPEPGQTAAERGSSVLSQAASSTKEPAELAAKPKATTSTRPKKTVQKLVSRAPPPPKPEVVLAPTLTIPTPPRPRTPSPPPVITRPVTPLPDFITQFKGMEWFEKYFPNCTENTMPKPWHVSAFVTMLVRVMKIAQYSHKVDVAEALLAIHQQESIPNVEVVYKALYYILGHYANPPTCQDPVQKEFIKAAVLLMQRLGEYDKDFCVELMVQFLEADKEVRTQVIEAFHASGVKDPHNYFSQELDSWDIWNLTDQERPAELRKMSHQWLDKWLTSFKIQLADSIERLKKGQGVHGRVTPSKRPAQPRGAIRKPVVDSIVEEEDPSKMEGVQMIPHPPAESPSRMMTVTFESAPDTSAIENASYIEAINYFCDIELEKNLDRIRGGGVRVTMEMPNEHKNTVLVLPKIQGKSALVRLGETHTSKCRPSRETALAVDLRFPPVTTRGRQPDPGQLYGFPSAINLPMKSVIMNPFPCSLDQYDPAYQQPVLLMLKTSQKYFVPSRSFIPPSAY